MQISRLRAITGTDDARRLEAIDPMDYEFARGVTLEGLMALADMRDDAWA